MTHSSIVNVTDATFKAQVLDAAGPVLVKFEAAWCGPCKAMKPAMDDIAAEYSGKLTVATVDIDENAQSPFSYNVRGVPTLLLFKQGKVVAQKVGLARKAELVTLLDSNLS